MNKMDCASVLAKVRLGDNRNVDELVLAEWFDTIGHLHVEEAMTAVREHRMTSPGVWLEPGHIIAQVKRARQGQADTTPEYYKELMSGERRSAPKPHNFDAMTRAWNNPTQFAIETEKYNVQLRAAGFEPVPTGGEW